MSTSAVTPQLSPIEQLMGSQQPTSSAPQGQSNLSPIEQLANNTPSGTQAGGASSNQASISAAPPRSTMGKLADWMDNVTADLKDGGDRTGVGTVMKALGAHGLDSGNSAAVGDFMGSLPLGLLKAAKGGAEVVPSEIGGEKGNTWRGVKDLVSGGLQAATMPSMFVGPEASALSNDGLLSDAASAASKVTTPITSRASALVTNIPKQTESKLVDAIGDIATNNGFAPSEDADTLVDATKHLATSFQQRAQTAYQALDDAAPGFQELRDKISSLAQAAKTQLNLDPEKAAALTDQLNDAKDTMGDLLSDDQKDAWQAADKDYGQFKALQRFTGKANASATDLTSDALTDVGKLKSGMQSLGNVSRKGTPIDVLARGFGDEGAANLRQITQDASDQTALKASAKTARNWALAGAATGAGGTGMYELYKALFGKSTPH